MKFSRTTSYSFLTASTGTSLHSATPYSFKNDKASCLQKTGDDQKAWLLQSTHSVWRRPSPCLRLRRAVEHASLARVTDGNTNQTLLRQEQIQAAARQRFKQQLPCSSTPGCCTCGIEHATGPKPSQILFQYVMRPATRIKIVKVCTIFTASVRVQRKPPLEPPLQTIPQPQLGQRLAIAVNSLKALFQYGL